MPVVRVCTLSYNQTMITVAVSKARSELRALLERVKAGDEVVLTQHGEPVAVLLHPSQLRARRASPRLDRAAKRLEELRSAPSPRRAGIGPARAEELAAEVRADRDAT